MPCGGIYPSSGGPGTIEKKLDPSKGGCWMCDRGGCKHFCDEWDTFIHARCVPAFLQTDEGKVVIVHGHEVVLNFGLEVVSVKDRERERDELLKNFKVSQ